VFITHCTTILWEKIQMRVKEVYFSDKLSLISGSSTKGVYNLLIVLNPSVSQEYFYYKLKTVPSGLFVTLKELVKVFVLDNISYLRTNENTFFKFFFQSVWETFLISKKRQLLFGLWPLQNFSPHQALNAWMATKFYSVPLVVDFPHSLFLVPEIFWQVNIFLNNEETELCCPIHKWSSKIL